MMTCGACGGDLGIGLAARAMGTAPNRARCGACAEASRAAAFGVFKPAGPKAGWITSQSPFDHPEGASLDPSLDHEALEIDGDGDPRRRNSTQPGESPAASIQAAMRKLVPTRWHLMDCLHDAWTVSSSVIDIVTDVLVAYSFYHKGHLTFFYLSLLIFGAAQLSYAFLFTGTWAAKHRAAGKLCVFLCVLPFGQLIPIFTWVESFRVPAIDRVLESLSLTPTGKAAGAPEAAAETSEADSLWGYIQRKYTAHAGFLAEAFVEAIPQAVLQLVAVLVVNDSSAVNIFSILMSITVVASKGYLVAYSIHRPSFAFNYLTIAADCFNLFASATWLFVSIGGAASDPLARHPWFVMPLGVGLLSSAYAGFATLIFTMMDDHLKVLHPGIYEGAVLEDHETVWFDIYGTRFVAWALGVVPVSVVYISAKFAILPVALFGSLDPEHAIGAAFYRPLFQFLNGRIGRDMFLTPAPSKLTPPEDKLGKDGQSSPGEDGRSECGKAISGACRALIMAPEPGDAEKGFGGARAEPQGSALTRAAYSQDRERFGALDRQLRLEVANRFLKEARIKQAALSESLSSAELVSSDAKAVKRPSVVTPVPVALNSAAKARLKVEAWAQGLKTVNSTRLREDNDKAASLEAVKLAEEEGRRRAEASHLNELLALMREQAAQQRRENLRQARDDALAGGGKRLQARSEILRHFLAEGSKQEGGADVSGAGEDASGPIVAGCGGLCVQLAADAALFLNPADPRWSSLRFRPTHALPHPGRGLAWTKRLGRRWLALRRLGLRVGGLAALAHVTLAAAAWVPATALFAAYSVVFPLTQLPYCVAAWDGAHADGPQLLLPCVLTWSYLACLLGLLALAPLVSRFQLMRADLRSAKGFPRAFYGKAPMRDLFQRYDAARGRLEVGRAVHARVSHYNALRIFSFLDEANHGPAPYI